MKSYSMKTPFSLKVKSMIWKGKFLSRPTFKRIFDVIAASIILFLMSPLMVVIIVLIKLDTKGNAFFKQQRVGLNGVHFTMWKFRSMVIDAESSRDSLSDCNEMSEGVLFKMKQDPRITRIGSYIRKASIDELPQLMNVIKGDMSLVGPRPPLPSEVALYSVLERQRLCVLPGITCLWQVCGRSDIPFAQQVELDIEYIESQSFLKDVELLLRTVPAVVNAKGAY